MTSLTIDQFDAFFRELHGHDPYPWQKRLAKQAIHGEWPGAIDLPTGSGKTACIDIAVFALACQVTLPIAQQSAPRRLFFCVNRRVIVDEAYHRAHRIAERLWQAEQDFSANQPTLHQIAEALRKIGGTMADLSVPPLDVVELRGGIYRDSRWARSIIQPTVVCTTLDQLGSRLLFRGYGVSPNAAPIQAALIAYDSLILLDEAHISEPFRQTLMSVQRYLDPKKWAEQALGVPPVQVVPMTATPNEAMRERGVIHLEGADRARPSLNNRLVAPKPAQLLQTKNLIADIVQFACELAVDRAAAVGIIVNRIATARAIYEKLCALRRQPNVKKRKIPVDAAIELVIGSMRPIDRDAQAECLRAQVGPDRPSVATQTSFTVATQCLEVGADYDFDVLITECASLDALRQRFGRLNRAGRKENSYFIDVKAAIVANEKDIKANEKIHDDKPLDPIYGNALARSWNWLWAHAATAAAYDATKQNTAPHYIDFGIEAFQQLLDQHGENGRVPKALLAPSAVLNAPVMLPAYVDMWCQTAPRPVPDPDISLFIHGPRGGEPDVQVCWRADLVEDSHTTRAQWRDIVALLPPTAAECISLPISRLRRWLSDSTVISDHGDTLGTEAEDAEGQKKDNHPRPAMLRCPGVLWRGANKNTRLITSARDVQPGDTLVLPASVSDTRALAHFPEADSKAFSPSEASDDPLNAAVRDVAEAAFVQARDRAALRLHPSLQALFPAHEAVAELFVAAARGDEPATLAEWSTLLKVAANVQAEMAHDLRQTLERLATNALRVEPYPDGRGVVITTRRRLKLATKWFIRAMDEGDDEASCSQRELAVSLVDHTRHVREAVAATLAHILPSQNRLFLQAADLHDWGKADERFQAMLRRTDRTDAWLWTGAVTMFAKSDGMPMTRVQRDAARRRAGLPKGFRHEMLSIHLAEASELLPKEADAKALILHLIASHHGYARPFAPVVLDDELPEVEYHNIRLSHGQRAALVPLHRLDSGVAERFWSLTARFGWWGLAYLEAILRLADQQASVAEDAGQYDDEQAVDSAGEISA